jgi:hypothetical protein
MLLAGLPARAHYDDPEPVYATSRVLAQRGPILGGFGLRDMLNKLHPGLTRLPRSGLIAEEDIEPEVIEQVIIQRGRLLHVGEQGAYPSSPAVILLLVHALHEPDLVTWNLELAALSVKNGRLVVLARMELGDYLTEISPEYEVQASVKLELIRLHPAAAALSVIVRTVEKEPDFEEERVERVVYALWEEGFEELLRLPVREAVTEVQPDGKGRRIVNVESVDTRLVVTNRRSRGLYELETETYRAESINGRVFHSETDLAILCWENGAYEECDPGC